MPNTGSCGAARGANPGSMMRRGVRGVRGFLVADDAATMVEYALLIALISLVVALTLLNIGTAVRTRFSSVSSCLAASSTC